MINVGLLHHDVFVSRAFLHSNLNDSAKKISNLPSNESLGPSQKSEEHYIQWFTKVNNQNVDPGLEERR